MERTITKIISILFNPLIVPTYCMILLLHMDVYFALVVPGPAKWKLIGLLFILTFLFPIIITLFLMKKGIVKSIEMESREERVFPYIITAGFFYLTYYLFKSLPVASIYNYFILGATFLIVISLIINFFWKISIHMMSLGGMFGLFLGISLAFMVYIPSLLFLILIISGLTGYARLSLKLHTPAQVYAGFSLGALIMLILLLLS